MNRLKIAAIALTVALTTSSANAVIYDWVEGMDPFNNPSTVGPWSYGTTETLGGPLTLMETSHVYHFDGVLESAAWWSDNLANIQLNATDEILTGGGEGRLPREVVMHPGSGDQYAVLRFTAPTAGNYDFNVSFTGNSQNITTTDVHVLVNEVAMFSGNVSSTWFDIEPGEGPTFMNSEPIQLAAGDTIDIAVGSGGNTYAYDLTGIDGWIESDAAGGSAGDYDGDGEVDGADLNVWRNQFGAQPVPAAPNADGNGDGKVDGADMLLWQRNSSSPISAAAASAVPEPGAGFLIVCGLAATIARLRREIAIVQQ
ncbi:MAG: hypothetical protein IT424_12505 [Pirellulales bacterium]|nr:hypothetical protein [Pirellulales bacterium]